MLGLVSNNLDRVCARHQRYIAVLSGLKVSHLTQPEVVERMKVLHQANLAGEESVLELTQSKTRNWFTSLHRPYKTADDLGHYKFSQKARWPTKSIEQRLFDVDFKTKAISLLVSPEVTGEDWDSESALKCWDDQGSVNMPLLKWWWTMRDGGIARIVDEELDMYKHHTRQRLFGNENKGWLVTAYYSIVQQLASQDPVHYAMYAALRPDHCTSLISYPYYAKYSEFDKEHPYTGGFEHVDHNIERLIHGNLNVISQIQGSISLDDETPDNCTKIAPGFHKEGVLENWWKRMPDKYKKNEHVTRVKSLASSPLSWEVVPCRQGDARITMPQLPHGAQPRFSGMSRRRCVLPWLTRVDNDHSTLPNTPEGAGTAQDIALARIACVHPKATPSGKSINNSKVPYRFPACVRLESLGALSDALIGLRNWDAPEVILEQEVLFGEDKMAALRYILAWRKRAYAAAHTAFEIIKQAEQDTFKSKSFWNKDAADYPFESEGWSDKLSDSNADTEIEAHYNGGHDFGLGSYDVDENDESEKTL
ncbi:hypothetical protein SBOR_6417 [Sclerotinia borealis F-4128]|uniref:Uncharacterized protein n=1 Tax=Sclerotinia borealis (strain F-4128) TaxID=1432307 RepID=W9CF56_SCLBF|nr:hypothetical protein SBOR_6417 [Sclerotinia borealis F-4128]